MSRRGASEARRIKCSAAGAASPTPNITEVMYCLSSGTQRRVGLTRKNHKGQSLHPHLSPNAATVDTMREKAFRRPPIDDDAPPQSSSDEESDGSRADIKPVAFGKKEAKPAARYARVTKRNLANKVDFDAEDEPRILSTSSQAEAGSLPRLNSSQDPASSSQSPKRRREESQAPSSKPGEAFGIFGGGTKARKINRTYGGSGPGGNTQGWVGSVNIRAPKRRSAGSKAHPHSACTVLISCRQACCTVQQSYRGDQIRPQ